MKLNDSMGGSDELLQVPVGQAVLTGNLVLPPHTKSLVIFSHGSGSSRFSPRNNFVAQQLQKKGMGTFLVDLLSPQEDTFYSSRFNIDLLTERLVEITKWLARQKKMKGLHFGYFGASTGAASALHAASLVPELIAAVVSRGGRPDLALDILGKVRAPTLLIVGELDVDVLRFNKQAYDALSCEKKLVEISGATHLFEEPGALETVSEIAREWFIKFLQKKTSTSLS